MRVLVIHITDDDLIVARLTLFDQIQYYWSGKGWIHAPKGYIPQDALRYPSFYSDHIQADFSNCTIVGKTQKGVVPEVGINLNLNELVQPF